MAEGGYTNYMLTASEQLASGSLRLASAQALAVVESSISIYERAMLLARLGAPDRYEQTPGLLAMIARALLTTGEFLGALILTPERKFVIRPAATWDIRGESPHPGDWIYRLDLPAPSGTTSAVYAAGEVIHVRLNPSPATPWRGRSPLEHPGLSTRLAVAIEQSFIAEAGLPTGRILPVPDGSTSSKWWHIFKKDVQQLSAKHIAFPETMRTGAGYGPAAAPAGDWIPIPLRPEFAQATAQARMEALGELASIFGVPSMLVMAANNAAAGALREAWRRCIFGGVMPIAKLIERELSLKLEEPVTISLRDLAAADIMGRARAFQSLLRGMSPQDAAEQVGFPRSAAKPDKPGEPVPTVAPGGDAPPPKTKPPTGDAPPPRKEHMNGRTKTPAASAEKDPGGGHQE